MKYIEWNGQTNNEKTKRGDDIMRLSKNGCVRIVYKRGAIQGKYAYERLTTDGYWDRWYSAKDSSDFIGEVERALMYVKDEPLDVSLLKTED